MELEVDYIKAYEQELQEIEEEAKKDSRLTDEQMAENLQKIIAKANAEQAEYRVTKNEELWNLWVERFYPEFCKIASVQGGKVKLYINEKTYDGYLSYVGKYTILGDEYYPSETMLLSKMLVVTQEMIVASKDDMVEMKFHFNAGTKHKNT